MGSIFRTADGAGVSKIYLTGYTPAPVDRFGREQPEIKKTSLGAIESVSWEKVESTPELIVELQKESVTVVSVEQTPTSKEYQAYTPKNDVAYIFGNETDGITEATLAASDAIIQIPMLGDKESLNVSVAAGIILFN